MAAKLQKTQSGESGAHLRLLNRGLNERSVAIGTSKRVRNRAHGKVYHRRATCEWRLFNARLCGTLTRQSLRRQPPVATCASK